MFALPITHVILLLVIEFPYEQKHTGLTLGQKHTDDLLYVISYKNIAFSRI